MKDSNTGKWGKWYKNRSRPTFYGDQTTYKIAADFFHNVEEVEDWGCGGGGFRLFCPKYVRYRGIDSTSNPYVDLVADLCEYRSSVEGILLRHVLEHNADWQSLLRNAVASFSRKLCIVLFTPFSSTTKNLYTHELLNVPNISFRKEDLTGFFVDLDWELIENIQTRSEFNSEHVFYIQKSAESRSKNSTLDAAIP